MKIKGFRTKEVVFDTVTNKDMPIFCFGWGDNWNWSILPSGVYLYNGWALVFRTFDKIRKIVGVS